MNGNASIAPSIRRNLIAGSAAALLLAGGLGGWAATAELAGAVVATGNIVVESDVKKVQHATGGVVGALLVRDSQRVKAGDVLLRLDETQARANFAIVSNAVDEFSARKARLEAEQEGSERIAFPDTLLARAELVDVVRILDGERRLFQLRFSAREGQKAQLVERIAQLKNEIAGLERQAEAKDAEIALIGQELKGVQELWSKNLVQINRLTTLQREAARLEGERGQLIATTAQSKGKIAELALQIIQIDQDMRSEVGAELSEVRAKLSEFSERKVAAQDQLDRIDVRAPQDGIIHELAVHTIGGVIAPGDVIALVVPDADTLTVEVKVSPSDIDQLRLGQTAVLRLSAFSQQQTPELHGVVNRISADLSHNERTGTSYYVVRIALPEEELSKLKGLNLIPGMPVEAFIQTGERSVMSYLVKPLSDHLARTFREG